MPVPARSEPLPTPTAETARIGIAGGSRRIRVAHWPVAPGAPPRAAVLLFPGLSEFIEKYEETAQDLTARGLVVLSLDWGGQGLSDRPLPNRQKIHATDFDHRLDEVDALLDWGAPHIGDLPVIILGHSMGGHLALRCAGDRPPERLAAVALSAPFIAIRVWRGVRGLAQFLAGAACAAGLSERYAPGGADFSEATMRSRLGRLTQDPRRQLFQLGYCLANPDLQYGGTTWGWLKAALDSCRRFQEPGFFERIACPVLLAEAGEDVLVSNKAIRRAAARLPDCTFVDYPNARHEILMEGDLIRDGFLAAFDGLLARSGL